MGLFDRKPKALVKVEQPQAETAIATPAIAIAGREVVLYRPELVIDLESGETVPGVDRQLACDYLVATLEMLSQEQHRGATVEFVSARGRFATARFTLPAWGASLDVVQPVNVVSREIGTVMAIYRRALAAKAKELHKGTQSYGEANAHLSDALQKWAGLREMTVPQVNDAEYIYVKTALMRAIVLNALVPVPVAGQAQMITPEARATA